MIVPSIDLQDGQAVQLIGGEKKALDAGDPRPLARKFGIVGDVAVVDLDAALGRGDHRALIRELLPLARCRVGGGIRSVQSAIEWLDAGATHVVLGTAARPDILSQLPKERVIAALDARHGEVVVEGWTRGTGRTIEERMLELRDLVGGFLVTFVEKEGRLEGIPLDRVKTLVEAAGAARLTVAGGVTTVDDVAAIDRMGADAQVGMALYTGRMDLGDAVSSVMQSDRPDGLWPTVVVDDSGLALGLCWSNAESVRHAVQTGKGVYHSRKRGLWVKGDTSGDGQDLLRIDVDCDRDALRFTVRQHGRGFCHTGQRTCWGQAEGWTGLHQVLSQRVADAPPGSYTRRLLDDAGLLASKLREEASELASASETRHVAEEAADVLFFTTVAMVRAGVTPADVPGVLDRRARKVTRRPGNAKPDGGR